MLTIVKGIGLLLLTLACFSVFSLKFPKGSEAMSGMANAAVASFLVEAVHHYITGDLLGIAFFSELGTISGSFGGIAAATLVPSESDRWCSCNRTACKNYCHRS